MRIFLALFGSLTFFVSAQAETSFRGSTVIVPPLLSKTAREYAPHRIMRMPVQAGVVESVVTTRFPNSDNVALIIKAMSITLYARRTSCVSPVPRWRQWTACATSW